MTTTPTTNKVVYAEETTPEMDREMEGKGFKKITIYEILGLFRENIKPYLKKLYLLDNIPIDNEVAGVGVKKIDCIVSFCFDEQMMKFKYNTKAKSKETLKNLRNHYKNRTLINAHIVDLIIDDLPVSSICFEYTNIVMRDMIDFISFIATDTDDNEIRKQCIYCFPIRKNAVSAYDYITKISPKSTISNP